MKYVEENITCDSMLLLLMMMMARMMLMMTITVMMMMDGGLMQLVYTGKTVSSPDHGNFDFQ